MDIRFVESSFDICFEEVNLKNQAMFKEEYRTLNEYNSDDINEWVKKLKGKGQLDETDRVLLTLLVELHKKVDHIESLIKNEDNELIELQQNSKIIGIHFDYIKTRGHDFLNDALYYAKVYLPVFPKREIPLYLYGVEKNIAKIHLISQKNQEDWNAIIMAKEREYIRNLKGINNDT